MREKLAGRDRIDVRAPAEWIDAVAEIAARDGVSVSRWLRRAANKELRSRGVEPPAEAFGEPVPKIELPKRPVGRPRKSV